MARGRAEFVVLALDIGSSSTRAALFDERARAIPGTVARSEYKIRYTPDGGAELTAESLRRAVARCVRQSRRGVDGPIRAICGCGFWHSLLGLDGSGRPTTPIFMWADSRSASDAAELRNEVDEREVQLRTGCMLRAAFWPAKLRWLRRTQPAVFKRTRRWVSPAQWLFTELFGSDALSASMASGTGLFDLAKRSWDDELCGVCGITPRQLGPIRDRAAGTDSEIFAAIGDGAASNLGSGAERPDTVAINVGTSAAVRAVEFSRSVQLPHGLFRYVIDDKRYVIGGATSNGGNLRRWSLREFGYRDDAEAERALARREAAANPLVVLPFWTAERAPSWPDGINGAITGLTQTTTRDDLLRAITTSAYYRLADILELLEQANGRADELIVSGGIRNSPASLAILADALGRDIRVAAEAESSLRGAAIYALEKLGAALKPTRAGKIVRHKPALAEQHRSRRARQNALEALLAR
jgi:gluconokinase